MEKRASIRKDNVLFGGGEEELGDAAMIPKKKGHLHWQEGAQRGGHELEKTGEGK